MIGVGNIGNEKMEDLLEDTERLLEEAKKLPPPTIKVTKTDKLIAEFYVLPITKLSLDFMYRVVAPVELVWQSDGSVILMNSFDENGQVRPSLDLIKEFVSKKWQEGLCEPRESVPEEVRWLYDLKEVELHECEIVRKK
jgi:hypothetical protein